MQEIERRLLQGRSIDENGCWIWTRSGSLNGYGQLLFRGRNRRVHRVAAHVWLNFDLDSELLVLHHCDVRRCFNPDHLFVGTAADNTADMMRKGRGVLPPPSEPLPFAIKRKAVTLAQAGIGIREAARRTGVTHTTVRRWLSEAARVS